MQTYEFQNVKIKIKSSAFFLCGKPRLQQQQLT